MDIKYIYSVNPGNLSYGEIGGKVSGESYPLRFEAFEGGLVEIGQSRGEKNFSYDNEQPKHAVFVQPFALSNRLVTNGEFLEFIQSDAYQRPELWLSEGWDWVETHKVKAPLYWRKTDRAWESFGFFGWSGLDPHQPVCHLNYFEAAAYAKWLGCRLPTEFEWEVAASERCSADGFTWKENSLQVQAAKGHDFEDLCGFLWQWTSSAYLPYPGFRAPNGAISEYNEKFMCGQKVLRGGAFVTAPDHFRLSYRNYFYPNQRWCFSGLRLAQDFGA